jgi:hypothetical protein
MMRFFPCDKTKEEQIFDFRDFGPISLESRPELGVAFRAINLSLDSDPIILKNCNTVVPDDRLNWDRV